MLTLDSFNNAVFRTLASIVAYYKTVPSFFQVVVDEWRAVWHHTYRILPILEEITKMVC